MKRNLKAMPAFDKPPRYRAFLLRSWEERGQGAGHGGVWRFSLEDAHTGQRRGFASLEEMVAFLESQLEEPNAQSAHLRFM